MCSGVVTEVFRPRLFFEKKQKSWEVKVFVLGQRTVPWCVMRSMGREDSVLVLKTPTLAILVKYRDEFRLKRLMYRAKHSVPLTLWRQGAKGQMRINVKC